MADILYVVEDEDGEMLDNSGDGGFTVWLSRGDAQEALDCTDAAAGLGMRVVRFVREEADHAR